MCSTYFSSSCSSSRLIYYLLVLISSGRVVLWVALHFEKIFILFYLFFCFQGEKFYFFLFGAVAMWNEELVDVCGSQNVPACLSREKVLLFPFDLNLLTFICFVPLDYRKEFSIRLYINPIEIFVCRYFPRGRSACSEWHRKPGKNVFTSPNFIIRIMFELFFSTRQTWKMCFVELSIWWRFRMVESWTWPFIRSIKKQTKAKKKTSK
jgi:hypothetical protein